MKKNKNNNNNNKTTLEKKYEKSLASPWFMGKVGMHV